MRLGEGEGDEALRLRVRGDATGGGVLPRKTEKGVMLWI